VIVAHARNVRLIGESLKKDDRLDAQTLARLARIDSKLLLSGEASQRQGASGSDGDSRREPLCPPVVQSLSQPAFSQLCRSNRQTEKIDNARRGNIEGA
jgi:hypothetical protein